MYYQYNIILSGYTKRQHRLITVCIHSKGHFRKKSQELHLLPWSVLSLFVLVRAAADPAHSAAQICARFYARECPVYDGVRAMLADSGSFAILTVPGLLPRPTFRVGRHNCKCRESACATNAIAVRILAQQEIR